MPRPLPPPSCPLAPWPSPGAPPPLARGEGTDGAGGARRTVLVVDDAAADRDLHCLLLRTWGLQAIAAADGWEGLVCARTLLPALVVSDVRMPQLDGWGLLERLRAEPRTAAIPVLLVTGEATRLAERRAHAAGAAGVLAKPLDLGVFQATTARLLGRAGN